MFIAKTVLEVRNFLKPHRLSGETIGLVPTMGAFHDGHVALMRQARAECDISVVSLFVNPAQFGPAEDFGRYPRDFDRDSRLAREVGVGLLFSPSDQEMYPEGFLTAVEVDEITERLCGKFRPSHFRGVATVVAKLLNIVQPDKAYFGEKDWQQLVVIKRMTADLNLPVEIIAVPTVRDADGLALSSRNQYLSSQERKEALVIPNSLKAAEEAIKGGERRAAIVKSLILDIIASNQGVALEYLSICRPDDFVEVVEIKGKVLVALAARIGKTRLIDNILVEG